ncbi:MAG: diacylglycerol kinase [Deltaproteobacteria bacterium]|nr:diacylglycerol kinase [Deltaproteobacteria bacterium]
MKPDTWLESLNCAVDGILHAVRTQRHLRWHLLAGLAVLVLAPGFAVSSSEFALLALAAGAVLIAELFNTAVEAGVDLVSPEFHPLAKAAKDVAAGAVLVAAFVAAAVGWVVLWPRVSPPASGALQALDRLQPVGIVSTLLSVLVLVILGKVLVGRGRACHGGFPSGHAAVSFAIATLLALHTRDATVAALSGLLALMVSHSRLLLRVHTRVEVAVGGALGAAVSALLYWLFA